MKYLNSDTNIVMVQAKRGLHKLVQSSMVFVKKIGGEDAFFRTLHLGGNIFLMSNEPHREKIGFLPMRKQRHRSASQ